MSAGSAAAQDSTPLYKQTPYDTITLDEENFNKVYKVYKLDLPDRKLPKNIQEGDEVVVRLLDKPDRKYRLQLQHVVKVVFFEDLLLAEVERLVREQNYNAAFPYFQLLLAEYATYPGVREAYGVYLQRIAELAYNQKNYGQALARVWIWNDFQPDNPAQQPLAIQILESWVTANNDTSITAQIDFALLLRELKRRFPSASSSILAGKINAIRALADDLAKQTAAQLTAQNPSAARPLLAQLDRLWPNHPSAAELQAQLQKFAPRITLGRLHAPLAGGTHPLAVDWNERRDARLFARPLAECVAIQGDLPVYDYPLGTVSRQEQTTTYAFNSAAEPLAPAYLERLGREQRMESHFEGQLPARGTVAWAHLQPRLTGGKASGVTVAGSANPWWGDAHLALLAIPPAAAWNKDKSPFAPWQPWQLRDGNLVPGLSPGQPSSPAEFKLVDYPDYETGRKLLQAGEVQMLERLAPWQVTPLKANRQLQVQPYAVKGMHFLLVNQRSAPLGTLFRRDAVNLAIDRQQLLVKISKGQILEQCVTTNNFWPQAAPKNLSPSWNSAAPELAMMQWQLLPGELSSDAADDAGASTDESSESAAAAKEATGKTVPLVNNPLASASVPQQLRLAIPRDEVARMVAEELKSQLEQAGIQLILVPSEQPLIPDGQTATSADLVYVIWHPVNPVGDCSSLFFTAGILPPLPEHVQELWRQMLATADPAAALKLFRQWESAIVTQRWVLPLLQLTEFSAMQRLLQTTSSPRVDPWQNLREWRMVQP
ncbi:MAG: ABC transporter substrate-binding protein [Pirellulales bacterium]|nr:ABC transporter substrate-binding protein [Pirellulales bacterium]